MDKGKQHHNPMQDNAASIGQWFSQRLRSIWILYVLRPFFSVAGRLVPKTRGRLLFFNGERTFADNLAILFRHALEKGEDCWVLNRHPDATGLAQVPPDRLLSAYSWRGLAIFLSSPVIVISHGIRMKYFAPYYLDISSKFVVNLWHGAPLKRLNFQVVGWDTRDNRRQILRPSRFVVCSDVERLMIAACYRMMLDDIWVTGTPRNDVLIHGRSDLLDKHPWLARKVILYAPTWREVGGPTRYFPFSDLAWAEIETMLERHDAYLIVRGHIMHGLDQPPIPFGARIRSASHAEFPEVQELLVHTDILVTDYSSICLDYVLTDRPIIFVPYDLESYATYRGFMMDYDLLTPGPKVTTQRDFVAALDRYLDDPDADQERRRQVRDLLHKHLDGKACERLLAAIRAEAS